MIIARMPQQGWLLLHTMFVDVALSALYVTLSAAKGLLLLEEEILRRLRLLRMT